MCPIYTCGLYPTFTVFIEIEFVHITNMHRVTYTGRPIWISASVGDVPLCGRSLLHNRRIRDSWFCHHSDRSTFETAVCCCLSVAAIESIPFEEGWVATRVHYAYLTWKNDWAAVYCRCASAVSVRRRIRGGRHEYWRGRWRCSPPKERTIHFKNHRISDSSLSLTPNPWETSVCRLLSEALSTVYAQSWEIRRFAVLVLMVLQLSLTLTHPRFHYRVRSPSL